MTNVSSVPYRFGRFELQPAERRLLADGEVVRVGGHAFDLLTVLVERAGHLVSKDELLERVWRSVMVEENTLQSHIAALRRVLGTGVIMTVSGQGYRLVLPVARVNIESPTVAPARKHNFPYQLTSFIGREREIAELAHSLGQSRLLTLTGAGGCGKTRLAIEFVRQHAHTFSDGTWLVELAPLSDAALVPQTVAAVLGVRETEGDPLTKTIGEFLASRSLLLLLDNAEHLLDACAQFAETLLRRCERLVIVVTSRERLALTGELVYRIPSLGIPNETDTTPDSIAVCESARLFIERAQLQVPHFAVNSHNAVTIASICRRLDGVALALELAAPRVRTLSIEQLSSGLDRRFEMLIEGSRTAVPRHRTLRSMIDWSYDLLRDEERAMLRTVSVFSGGWTLSAAEIVFRADSAATPKAIDLLASLADKNLIVVKTLDGSARYSMLDTVREYAHDRLLEANEEKPASDRHLAFFLEMAEQASQNKATGGAAILVALEFEHDNFRSALAWASKAQAGATSVRLAGALAWFWLNHSLLSEGRRWLAAALREPDAKSELSAYTYALQASTVFAQRKRDHPAARSLAEENLAVSEEAGNKAAIAAALHGLGTVAQIQRDLRHASEYYERALSIFRELDNKVGISVLLCNLGQLAVDEGRNEHAISLLMEGLALLRARGDYRLSLALALLGLAIHYKGDSDQARTLLAEALAASREIRNHAVSALALTYSAIVCIDCSDAFAARSALREALKLEREVEREDGVYECLMHFGEIALAFRDFSAAAQIWGQTERLEEQNGWGLTPSLFARRERGIAVARASLGDERFGVAWNEGRAMTFDHAVNFALNLGPQEKAADPGTRRQ